MNQQDIFPIPFKFSTPQGWHPRPLAPGQQQYYVPVTGRKIQKALFAYLPPATVAVGAHSRPIVTVFAALATQLPQNRQIASATPFRNIISKNKNFTKKAIFGRKP
jgi:hypothetical protein